MHTENLKEVKQMSKYIFKQFLKTKKKTCLRVRKDSIMKYKIVHGIRTNKVKINFILVQ